ncbi:cysteine export CydDC family ABC transporter permease subunit/ATP-binding protein CydC [Thioflavicoccus mobilis 8321]|uniref:Cysteine export CydDC family ABC transporter permease subunit/ATP-binding protein CydC n=1 Tax=Thioflavicoccus mobilis 8321 TaxID=765912 RepID=L0GR51_9GAMM|nr:thiol reductant ABC exporter subunit CydC [Thioflavicoccus mobilis]AGA89228.1 cysteine export CydDC family ABC transporter permease subunit/ATP-binding protein CydC [Thioflavicoccus mobilis 8321]
MRELARLLRLMRPYAGWMVLGLLAALVTLVANVGLLAVSGWFIAAMAAAGASGTPINYYTPAALIRAFAILRTGGRYVERLVTHEATLRLLARLRVWLFEHLEPLAPAGLQDARSGDLLSRIGADIDALDRLYLRLLVPLLVAVVGGTAAVVFLAFYDWGLALVALAGLLVAGAFVPWLVGRLGAEAAARQVTTAAELRTAVVDGLQGMAELAIYGRAEAQAQAVDRLSVAWIADQRRLAGLDGLSLAAVGLAANLTLWGGLLIVIPLVGSGQLAGPELVMIALFLLACFEAVAPLPAAFQSLATTLTAARRLFAIVDAQPAVVDPQTASPEPERLDLIFDEVALRYAPERPWALHGVSFRVEPGERVAVVGATGSGKSSLVNLLLRFWDYQAGSIRLGGHELRRYRAADLRRRIAVVSQHAHLFHTSIRDNLLLANPNATDEALQRACSVAQLDAFIASLPEGWDTLVGEAGIGLSGGQARRLAIARAVLRDAPILILDEPTEGLDSTTAHDLMTAIHRLMAGRTVLLITHRFADLGAMDRILVLDRGRLVDQGRHEELIGRCEGYWEMFERVGGTVG